MLTKFVRQSPKKKNQSTLQPIPHQGPANVPSLPNKNQPASPKPCPHPAHGHGQCLDRSEGPVLLPVWTRLSVVEKRAHESRDPRTVQFGLRLGTCLWIPDFRIQEKMPKMVKNEKNLLLDDVSIVPVEKQTTFHFYRNQYLNTQIKRKTLIREKSVLEPFLNTITFQRKSP